MPRYVLKESKVADWVKWSVQVADSFINAHPTTLKKIKSRRPVNGKTIDGLARLLPKELKSEYRKLTSDLFEIAPPDYKISEANVTKATLALNTYKSNALQKWIEEQCERHTYDYIGVFSYTNETLHPFLKTLPLNVCVLARNWVVEQRDEEAFNNKYPKRTRPWEKSKLAKMGAELLAARQSSSIQQYLSLEQRFYDSPPFLKGAILWDSKSGRRAAYFGFYRWEGPKPEGGGSPYQGERWCAVSLPEDEGDESELLESLKSRFDGLWESSASFEEVLLEEAKYERERCAHKVWHIDSRPYKIVIPGVIRDQNSNDVRTNYPDVNYPDAMAADAVRMFLKGYNVKADIEVMTLPFFEEPTDEADLKPQEEEIEQERNAWYEKNISSFDGHVVFICLRTLTKDFQDYLGSVGFPYKIIDNQGAPIKIEDTRLALPYQSPLDAKEHAAKENAPLVDYCLIGRCDRAESEREGKCFVICGIHAIGTLAGSVYLTDAKNLRYIDMVINKTSENNDFSLLVRGVSPSPQNIDVEASIFDGPSKLEPVQT